MLASTVDIVNVDGTHTYSLNNDYGTPGFSPLADFDVTLTDRAEAARYKQQASGSWPTRSYEGEMSMHIEGNLFSDTQAHYWTERQNLLLALRGAPGANITAYKRGTLYVTPQGSSERWKADFGPLTISAPVQANQGTGTPILLTLVSWTSWFIGETSGNKFWWS